MRRISVHASTDYDVLVEHGLLRQCGSLLAGAAVTRHFVIVTDDTVDELYRKDLLHALDMAGCKAECFVFPHGEASKCSGTLLKLYDFLCESGITRSDCLIALGGGVVGDLTGFAAATFLRGIRYIQIPTTLLAQIDSSVGGKTAINIPGGKNLVGAFKQPSLVICDPDTLKTLPAHILSDGIAEAIKYGMIRDPGLFALLDAHNSDNVLPQADEIIARCVTIKRDIVTKDEFDTGERMLLNFGHTLGHAIERHSEFAYTHGQAVAAGMCMLSARTAAPAVTARLIGCVNNYGLPTDYDAPMQELTALCGHDKKRMGGELSYVVCPAIGQGEIRKASFPDFCRMMEESL